MAMAIDLTVNAAMLLAGVSLGIWWHSPNSFAVSALGMTAVVFSFVGVLLVYLPAG